jgi:sigma-B regulation protein RsbU (phosphoserine phosphatase)
VGGDLYDFVEISGERLVVLIGDVSGKGVPAALMMAKVISDFRAAATRAAAPAAILADLNAGLAAQSRRGMFVTAACLDLDAEEGRVAYADAGHLPLLWHRRQGGAVETFEPEGGPPLGIVPGAQYPEQHLALGPGDTLLLYTDGVVEARGPGAAPFGLGRMADVMGDRLPATGDLVGDILAAVRAHADGTPLHDDVTMVAVRWRPSN